MGDAVLTSVEDHVLVITFNRPEVKNVIDTDLSQGVRAALKRLSEDDDLRVGVLTGAGGTFCAGLDLKAFAKQGMPKGIGSVYKNGSRKPVVAAVEGVAYGGGLELALVADIIVSSRSATFGALEVKVGLFPAGGALLKLPRFMPAGKVAEMAMAGTPISAEEAHAYGLATRLTEPGASLASALELAHAIAANAPLGVAAAKQVLQWRGKTVDELWDEQNELVKVVFTSEDAKEGSRAFAERRAPEWHGR